MAASLDMLTSPNEVVRVLNVDESEAIGVIGLGAKLKIKLEVNGKEVSSELLTSGRHIIKIYWGGIDNQFGFFANGRLHTLPITSGASKNSFGSLLKVGDDKVLATIVDFERSKTVNVRLVVQRDDRKQ